MSPIQKLKTALQTGDWNLAADAYESLTGTRIEPAAEPAASAVINDLLEVLAKHGFLAINEATPPSAEPPPDDLTETDDEEQENDADDIDIDEPPLSHEGGIERLAKSDIDGEPPEETVKEQASKTQVFGGSVRQKFVTQDRVESAEVARNRRTAQLQKTEPRPAKKLFRVTCSECERKFDSPIKPSSDVGQKCDHCLKNARG